MTQLTRRGALGAGLTAVLIPASVAEAKGSKTVSVKAHLVTKDSVPDKLTAGFLTDSHLGRGTVNYKYDRSTGGKDSFRVYYPDGWFDVDLDLTYAPTTTSGTGKIVGGSGKYKGASGKFTKVTGTFDASADLLDATLTGKITLKS